jgi:hypothetical protein
LTDWFQKILLQRKVSQPGELQLPLAHSVLVGGKFGPPVFHIAEVFGKEETISKGARTFFLLSEYQLSRHFKTRIASELHEPR